MRSSVFSSKLATKKVPRKHLRGLTTELELVEGGVRDIVDIVT